MSVFAAPATAAKEPPQATGWAVDAKTEAPAKADAKAEAQAPMAKRDRVTIRERRELGLTFRNVRRVLEDLEAEGVLERDDVSGTAVQVLDRLVQEDPDKFITAACEGDRDWGAFFESLIAFLERLLPLIIQIFGFMS